MWGFKTALHLANDSKAERLKKLSPNTEGNFEIDHAELVMMLRGVRIEVPGDRKRYSIKRSKAA